MSSFISLDAELPYELKQDVADIAKTVWREIGGLFIETLDPWWHLAHLFYLPTPPFGIPKVIFLNCVEGEPDMPEQSAAYTVNLSKYEVIDRRSSTFEKHPVPESCLPAIDRIRDWTWRFQERKDKERKQQRELEEKHRRDQENRHKAKVAAYEQRLHDFRASQPSPSKRARAVQNKPGTRFGHCPECVDELVACEKCFMLSCPRSSCPGQGSDELQQCAKHPYEVYCSSCREQQKQTGSPTPLLAICPLCKTLKCGGELLLCDGKQSADRASHPVRILSCQDCGGKAEKEGNVLSCLGINRYRYCSEGSYTCNECAQAHGRLCKDHPHEWWCAKGGCAERSMVNCPTCDILLCPSIKYQTCDLCGQPGSCLPCRKRGRSSDDKELRVEFNHVKCNDCKVRMSFCKTHGPGERKERCDSCYQPFCGSCRSTVNCSDKEFCGMESSVCSECFNDGQCPYGCIDIAQLEADALDAECEGPDPMGNYVGS
ncbi:hypothetical protein F4780DRAFT_218747 [Xylariomycetidae sp. FL0641]|nr:hypothetical protein F4780DRAFT_218747 [Xylariomycetidae sp. FL0641]